MPEERNLAFLPPCCSMPLSITVPLDLTFIPEARGPGLYRFLHFYTVPNLSSVVGLILGFTQASVSTAVQSVFFTNLLSNPSPPFLEPALVFSDAENPRADE